MTAKLIWTHVRDTSFERHEDAWTTTGEAWWIKPEAIAAVRCDASTGAVTLFLHGHRKGIEVVDDIEFVLSAMLGHAVVVSS